MRYSMVCILSFLVVGCTTCPVPRVCPDCTEYGVPEKTDNICDSIEENRCMVLPSYDLEGSVRSACEDIGGRWLTEERECFVNLEPKIR